MSAEKTISEALRDWADASEKAADFFMDDDADLADETRGDVSLLRAAADRLDELESA